MTNGNAVCCIPPHVCMIRISWLFGSQNIQIFWVNSDLSYRPITTKIYQKPIHHKFTSTILHFLVKHLRHPACTDFPHNRCSRKIVNTEPVLTIPTASAISCTLTRRFCNTVFSTARQFSSQTASDGSSSRLFLPWRNSAAQRLTVAYDGLIHRIQQSLDCASAAAERSPVLEILSLHNSGFC